ncbi:hypothetical protein CASFOL_006528 [Castilleja foliolosa]|uniref:DUF7866 domain-containing protein n=1 Tax=Castilleja foliolosa TaxID=1961234 RepID=A0ABD3EAI2_9LAMI
MRAVRSGIFWSVFIVFLILSLHEARLSMGDGFSDMVPMVELGEVKTMMMVNVSRRKLSSFQVCSPCMCCGGGNKNYCLPSPCCYAINCNIPNRPFGFCSFTPKTCNCFQCHI